MNKKLLVVGIISIFLLAGLTTVSSSVIKKTDNKLAYRNELTKTSNKFVNDENINLKKGDIVFRYVDENLYPAFRWVMHPLIFTGDITEDDGRGLLYEFVEAHGNENITKKVVKYSYYPKYRILDSKDPELYKKIFRIDNATDKQIDNAVAFAESQIGRPFLEIFLKPYKNYNPKEDDTWYCTEIIWAAYYNCNNSFPKEEPPGGYIYGEGINIDLTPGPVFPFDIQNSPNVVKHPLFSSPTNMMIKPHLFLKNNLFKALFKEIFLI